MKYYDSYRKGVLSWRRLGPELFQRLLYVQFIDAILLRSPRRRLRAWRFTCRLTCRRALRQLALGWRVFNVVFALGGLHLYAHHCQRVLGNYSMWFRTLGFDGFYALCHHALRQFFEMVSCLEAVACTLAVSWSTICAWQAPKVD